MNNIKEKKVHPVEEAKEALLCAVPKRNQGSLRSKLHLIHLKREKCAQKTLNKITREQTAKRSFGSSVTLQMVWDGVEPLAQQSSNEIIEACFEAECKDDRISSFVSEDIKHFLSSFMQSRFGHSGPSQQRSVAQYKAKADTLSKSIPHEVRHKRQEFNKSLPPKLDRMLKWVRNNPIIAWIMFIFFILFSIAGAIDIFSNVIEKLK